MFTYFHSEGLAVGMADVDVSNEGDANGDLDEKDDAELCYTKHTGNYHQHELLCHMLVTCFTTYLSHIQGWH